MAPVLPGLSLPLRVFQDFVQASRGLLRAMSLESNQSALSRRQGPNHRKDTQREVSRVCGSASPVPREAWPADASFLQLRAPICVQLCNGTPERERERYIYIYVHIYIYMCTYIYIHIHES